MGSQTMALQIADLCSRQELKLPVVCIVFTMVLYSQAELCRSQSPKILYSAPQKQRSLLPPAQKAITESQILHSDQALTTLTSQLSEMIGHHFETDITKKDNEMKETESDVT